LLERGVGGVQLTSDGVTLLPYVKNVLAEHDRLKTAVDALNGLQSGLIRIGTFSSVATHWLPNIIRAFQRDYPKIDYELLLGDYTEIDKWLEEGRIDCGFNRLPAEGDFDSLKLATDRLLAVLPEGHPLAACDRVPIAGLSREPFILLEKGARAEIAAVFERNGLRPNVRFTTWDDYAVMSMVESGLGVSILPELILRRVPYRIAVRALDVPAVRQIGFLTRRQKTASLAVRRFMEYLDKREGAER